MVIVSRACSFALKWTTSVVRSVFVGRCPEIFDDKYYSKQSKIVSRFGFDPYLHYVMFGARKGFDPAADFNTSFYLAKCGPSRLDPVRHYLRYGVQSGFDPSPSFNTKWYLEAYPDVRASGVNPLLHYRKHGKQEGRVPSSASAQMANISDIVGIPSGQIEDLSRLQMSERCFSISSRSTYAGGGVYARRFCLLIDFSDDTIMTLLSSFKACAKNSKICVSFDAYDRMRNSCAKNSMMLSFEHAYVAEVSCQRWVDYAEVHLWDLRTEVPRVAAVFPSGFFVLGSFNGFDYADR